MYFGISFHFSWLIYFYFMVTNFYSFYKKEKIIINNCGCLCNCSPEPEFIGEIVETIWKTLYVESPTSTIPPCRQNDVQNAIAGRTHRPFFFFLKWPHGNFREISKSLKAKTFWLRRCYYTPLKFLMTFSLSHASPSQLSSPTQKNKIIKSPFRSPFTKSLRFIGKLVFKS